MAKLTVTQWFPCTTPPERDGEYQCRGCPYYFKCPRIFRILFVDGKYLLVDNPSTPAGAVAMNWAAWAGRYEWRGLAEKPKREKK
jgi:hypothetical protein